MLTATGERSFGRATLRSKFLFGNGFWAHAVERQGLTFDTRYISPSDGSSARYCLQLVTNGALELVEPEAATYHGPFALLLSENQFEGANGARPLSFRSFGDPFRAVDIRIGGDWLAEPPSALPRRLELGTEAFRLANRLATMRGSDAEVAAAARALLEELVRGGVLRPGLAAHSEIGSRVTRLWSALRPMAERFYSSPTLQEVSTESGISVRQLARDVEEFLTRSRHSDAGWRDTTRRFRLKLAVLGLSAPDVTIAQVADAAGYSSTVAMARAFQDAGLPAPMTVREGLRRQDCRSEHVNEQA
jgi:AraC-like DNA-binding protein